MSMKYTKTTWRMSYKRPELLTLHEHMVSPAVFFMGYVNEQFRDIGNIGHIRLRRKTIQRHWQHWEHKTQEEDHSETLATLGT
jgi:hypothetical protein